MKTILIKEAVSDYIVKVLNGGTSFKSIYQEFTKIGIKLVDEMLATNETDHREKYSTLRELFLKLDDLSRGDDPFIVNEIFETLYGDIMLYARSIAPLATSSLLSTRDLCDSIFFGWSVKTAETMFAAWAAYVEKESNKNLSDMLGDISLTGCEASFALEVFRSIPESDPYEILSCTSNPFYEVEEAKAPCNASIQAIKAKVVESSVTCLLGAVQKHRDHTCASSS